MSSSNAVIQSVITQFHSKPDPYILNVVNPPEKFGVVKMKMKKTKISSTPLFLLFTIDITGSMGDPVTNGDPRSHNKMYYLVQTFVNMINYLVEQDIDIHLQINTFNVGVNKLVQPTLLDSANVNDIIEKIKALVPDGSTNIGIAISSANQDMTDYKTKNPDFQYGHIFMSDGDPTYGEKDHDLLQKMVDGSFMNTFIGFGLSHNATLFNKFSDIKNAEYHFVDNLENTGMVYGEIIHQFLYPAIKSAKISIENGVIYDWKTNSWVDSIEDTIIVSEVEKTYHIKSSDPDNLVLYVYGIEASQPLEERNTENEGDDETKSDALNPQLLYTDYPLPDLMDVHTNDISCEVDLSKYMFRQRTQEMLFIGKYIDLNNGRAPIRNKIAKFKKALRAMFQKMRRFMRENGLIDDPLMNMLCDDISVTYKLCGTRNGVMFTSARQTSQGRQATYSATSAAVDDFSDFDDPRMLSTPRRNVLRQNAFDSHDDEEAIPMAILSKTTSVGKSHYLPMPPILELNLSEEDGNISSNDATTFNLLFAISEEFKRTDIVSEVLPEDDLVDYTPTNNNTSCYSTPSKLSLMRTLTTSV
jgi:hypothetical protein